jgi:hypothetical protein
MTGDAYHTPSASDFIAVLDANAASTTYGQVLASRDVGVAGAMAHHTELSLPVGHALFASDFGTGQVFLLDVSDPLTPRVTGRIDSVPGFRRPHSFARLPNGHVLATLQFGNGFPAIPAASPSSMMWVTSFARAQQPTRPFLALESAPMESNCCRPSTGL